jgi:primosomal protein N'
MFPPFSRIIELVFRDRFEDRAERMAMKLAEVLSGNGLIQITGPYSPIVDRQADMHIRTIRISLRKDRNLRPAKTELKSAISKFERDNRYDGHITINVYPS